MNGLIQPMILPVPTGGTWTRSLGYDPETQEAEIEFADGFTATYPGIDAETYKSMSEGAVTRDGRSGSVGAWLHQNPDVMHNYF